MSSETPAKSADAYRLPTNVKPTHYDITLRTDLKEETFGGAVKIQCVLRLALDDCI
jgi:aminopeptidase 2